MIKRITDLNGLFLRDDFEFDIETEIGLEVEPAQGFILPKWDGEKWIEGGVLPELIEPLPIEPTLEEKVEILAEKVEQLEILMV